jgi:hypothetical protein
MTTPDLTPFLSLRRHLKIAHHIPGRIRLRVGADVVKDLGKVDPRVFDRILGAIDGIEDVRINPAAGSVVVRYSTSRIQASWWETLVKGEDGKAITLLRRLLEGQLAPAVAAAQDP